MNTIFTRSLPKALATLAALAATSVVGCAENAEAIGESTDALGQAVDVPNPSGAYFARISANGSGCPAGSWAADISPDGQTFTVTFSGYEATVDPGQAFAIKDCTLAIDLKSPEGFSFSVSSFHYQGYALLDQPGMSAKQTAKYYFQGNPLPAKENRSDMTGPYDSSYLFSDDIPVTDLVWSPCGANRVLNAQTRLVLNNNAQRSGAGYLNTTSVDGEMKTIFRFGLTWRQCGAGNAEERPQVPVYRGYNPSIGDHVQGLAPNEGAPAWQPEGVSFRIFSNGGPNRQPIYRCRYNGGPFHFISNGAECEGHVNEGQLGFVRSSPKDGYVPIYRCYYEGGSDHLSTVTPQECVNAGFRVEGVQGYALP